MVSVETALTLACGSKGAPLSCVIRVQEAPDLNGFGQLTWEESAIVGTPLLGLDYHADRMTVHPTDSRSQRWSTRYHRAPGTLRQ
jgi:hypothetical protein